jgi:hypothetical protein
VEKKHAGSFSVMRNGALALGASELSNLESETQSLTLREEHKLRVFENWVLRRIFGPQIEYN